MSPKVVDIFELAGATLEGRFVVDAVVAEGGFGVVYRAQQAALDRPIALKVLKTPPRFDEAAKKQFLAGFAAEAKTIARIAHPNIVHVYDFGVSEMPSGVRAAWMALEWLTGVTFEQELQRRRGLGGRSPVECLAILRPILSALASVHAGGIAHRDLKPANIMHVPTPGGATLKLLDFGIAKIMAADEAPGTGHTQTRSNRSAFSPGYAAPEQISNGRSGPWTDVHAMGLILTEMLTDRAALDGEDTTLLFQQILDRVRPTPAKYGVQVGPWEAVLCRALAVAPAERYRDAGELLRALEGGAPNAPRSRVTISTNPAVPSSGAPSSNEELAAMPTQQSPSATTLTQEPSRVTTSTPTSQPRLVAAQSRPRRTPAYAAAGALVLAVAAGLGWRAVTAGSAPPAPSVFPIVQPPSAAPAPGPSAVETTLPIPAVSDASSPSLVPPTPPSPGPRTPTPPRTPPRGSVAAPPAASSAPQTSPAPSGKIIIE